MPVIKITKREIDRIPLAKYGKQNFYWDTEAPDISRGNALKTMITQRERKAKSKFGCGFYPFKLGISGVFKIFGFQKRNFLFIRSPEASGDVAQLDRATDS